MLFFYVGALGREANAPASAVWFRSPPEQVPHVEIPPPPDVYPPHSFWTEYLDSDLEELDYF